ncbi:MAG: hypothetical protein P8N93_06860 [Flavobacteriaceae bacterium]|nr:hypothetical protein [Flavobacteriaceae bacterium]
MKKLLFLFTTLLFISCSSDGDDSNDSNDNQNSDSNLLVKTITITDEDHTRSEEYFYEGNKIERKLEYYSDYNNSDDVYSTTYYTYANNKISNVKEYDYNNDLEREWKFVYDSNGNLTSYSEESFYNSNSDGKSTYSFDYDGTYILMCIDGDFFKYTTNSNGDLIFYNAVQSCNFSAENATGENYYSVSVEYDNNPSPFRNIEGNNFLISGVTYLYLFTYADIFGYHNNVKKISTVEVDDDVYIEEWTYDYNSYNYPRNIQWLDDEGMVIESTNIEYY